MFTIPEWDDDGVIEDPPGLDPAVYPQAELHRTDFDILLAGFAGRGVVFGGAITPSSPTGMKFDLEASRIAIGGVGIDVDEQLDVPVADSNLTQPRFDFVVIDEAGLAQVLQGDPLPQSPRVVDLPDDVAPIGYIYVPAGLTHITDSPDRHITDKRVFVAEPLVDVPPWIPVPADTDRTRTNTIALAADPDLKFTMSPNTRYRFRAVLWFAPGVLGTSGVKWGFNCPQAATRVRVTSYERSDGTVTNRQPFTAYNTAGIAFLNDNAAVDYLELEGFITNGATGGDFAPTWAQRVGVADNLTRLAGSYLEYAET